MAHYIHDDNNNRIEGLSKEEIYALLAEAIQTGQLPSVDEDTAFVTMFKSIVDGETYKMAFCTQAQYNQLEAQGLLVANAYYIITDDESYDDIVTALADLQDQITANANNIAVNKTVLNNNAYANGYIIDEASSVINGFLVDLTNPYSDLNKPHLVAGQGFLPSGIVDAVQIPTDLAQGVRYVHFYEGSKLSLSIHGRDYNGEPQVWVSEYFDGEGWSAWRRLVNDADISAIDTRVTTLESNNLMYLRDLGINSITDLSGNVLVNGEITKSQLSTGIWVNYNNTKLNADLFGISNTPFIIKYRFTHPQVLSSTTYYNSRSVEEKFILGYTATPTYYINCITDKSQFGLVKATLGYVAKRISFVSSDSNIESNDKLEILGIYELING